jgi:hypothetical protein
MPSNETTFRKSLRNFILETRPRDRASLASVLLFRSPAVRAGMRNPGRRTGSDPEWSQSGGKLAQRPCLDARTASREVHGDGFAQR